MAARAGHGWLWAGLALIAGGVAPIASAMMAGLIAAHLGCRLDEGDVHPCVALGRDWGSALYAMGVAGWLALVTIWLVPAGLLALLVGGVQIIRTRRARP